MSPTHRSRPEAGPLLSGDDPWLGYTRIAVEIGRTPRQLLVVRAAREGLVGAWPWRDGGPVHVMTAWDPGDERPGVATNRRRQAALEEELLALAKVRPLSTWAASGYDPETGYRDEGVAISGMEESAARALAGRYGQEAIFSWTRREWAIVASAGPRRVVSGWTLETLEISRPSRA
jgi:Protein of unknown function (DUF3293)